MNSYRQFCGVARALDLVGERWSLLIVRDLLLGPRRYSDLQRSLGGISPSVLSQRLDRLSGAELIQHDGDRAYSLTSLGRALEPVVLALGHFGSRYLDEPRPDDQLDARWAMVSLKRRYRGSRSRGTVVLEVGASGFTIDFGGNTISVRDGTSERADARVSGAIPGWFALLKHGHSLGGLVQEGRLHVDGKKGVARALVRALGATA